MNTKLLKILLIISIAVLLSLETAFAVDINKVKYHYSFSNSTINTTKVNSSNSPNVEGTVSNVTIRQPGKITDGIYTNTSKNANITVPMAILPYLNWSVSGWIKGNSSIYTSTYWSMGYNANVWIAISRKNSGELNLYCRHTAVSCNGSATFSIDGPVIVSDVWSFVTVAYNENQTFLLCVNNNCTMKSAYLTNGTSMGSFTTNIIGKNYNTDMGFNGSIDEVTVFNYTLSQAEVSELYRSGQGTPYPFNPVQFNVSYSNYTNFTNKNYTRSLRTNVSYNCLPGTDDLIFYFLNRTNQSIGNSGIINNCTGNSTNYFFNWPYVEERNETTMIMASWTISSINSSINEWKIDLYAPSDVLTYTVFNQTHYNVSLSCIDSINANLNYSLLINGASSMSGNMSNNTNVSLGTPFNVSPMVFTLNCTDNLGSNVTNFTYNVSSLFLRLFDENNLSQLTFINSTIILKGYEGGNLTYQNILGNLFISRVVPSEIVVEIRALIDGYGTRTRYLHIVPNTNYEFNIYLLRTENSTASVIVAIDGDGKVLPNAKVVILRENMSGTDSFYTLNELISNFEGQTIHDFMRNNIYYKFQFWYNDVLVSETGKTYIFQDTLTHQVNLIENQLKAISYAIGAYAYMTPIRNNSGLLEVNFTFSGQNIKGGRIEVKRSYWNNSPIIIAQNSSLLSADMLNIQWTPEQNANYIVSAYVDTNTSGSDYLVQRVEWSWPSDSIVIFGFVGILATLLLVGFIALLFADYYALSISGSIIVLALSAFYFKFISLTWATIVFLGAAAAFIIFTRPK